MLDVGLFAARRFGISTARMRLGNFAGGGGFLRRTGSLQAEK